MHNELTPEPQDNQNFRNQNLPTGRKELDQAALLRVCLHSLSTLTEAGLPFLRSMKIIAEHNLDQTTSDAFIQAIEFIECGNSLSEAFALVENPKIFEATLIRMIEVSERIDAVDPKGSSSLPVVFKDYFLIQDFLPGNSRAHYTTPHSTELLTALQISFRMQEAGITRPDALRFVHEQIADSDVVVKKALDLIISGEKNLDDSIMATLSTKLDPMLVHFINGRLVLSENGYIDGYYLDIKRFFADLDQQKIGPSYIPNELRKYSYALGTSLMIGTPIIMALEFAGLGISKEISDMTEFAAECIREGDTLAESFKKFNPELSPAWLMLVDVGEETGELDRCLLDLALNRTS